MLLDGHTHSVVAHDAVDNAQNQSTGVTQTGTGFKYIGKLVISPEGKISTELVPITDVPYTNTHVTATIDSVKTLMRRETDRVVGKCDFDLIMRDASNVQVPRKGESNLSDLVADAFRLRNNADIGLFNGGGIRNGVPAGTLTYGSTISIMPFYNLTCTIEATGEMIVNMLGKCIQKYPEEDGNFAQVSGMKYTVHTVSHTVSDVMVLNRENGKYEPIVADKTYTIGALDYYTSGFYGTLKNAKLVEQTTDQICKTLADFIEYDLGGVVGDDYRQPQGRITFVED